MVDNQQHQWQSMISGHQQRSPGVRGTGGTLRINLKIPKEEEVKEDQNYDDDNQHNFGFEDEDKGQIQKKINDSNNSIRICHVCNKGFSSGKALGGFMRIHVQASNNKEFISGKKRNRLNQPNIACYKKRKLQKHEEEDDDDEDESGGVDTLRKKMLRILSFIPLIQK